MIHVAEPGLRSPWFDIANGETLNPQGFVRVRSAL